MNLAHRLRDCTVAFRCDRRQIDVLEDRVDRALSDRRALEINAAHATLRGERNECRLQARHVTGTDAVLVLGEDHDRAAFRRLVRERGELCSVGQFLIRHALDGTKLAGLPVAERDGAGLVEKKRIDIAGRLDRAARHGEHVEAHQAIHAGDADRGQQCANRRRDQRHKQCDQHDHRNISAGVSREARDGDRGEHENQRHAGEQDIERDLVRRLLALRALDQADHLVDESRAGRSRDADLDPVGQHLGAAGHRRAISAGFADHRRGLAGDRRLVDRGHAFDDFTIGGNNVAGLDQHDIAYLELVAWDQLVVGSVRSGQQLGLGLGPAAAERIRLRLAASFRHRFREVGEQHGEPQPEDDLEREADAGASNCKIPHQKDRRERRHDGNDEHDRVLRQRARIELAKCIADRRHKNASVKDARGF